jgi:hypothetical protein
MMINERGLHGMQLVAVRKAFDRPDALALGLDRKHQAGPDRLVVEDHGARAADTMLAADMRSGQPAFVADDVDQRLSRLGLDGVVMTIDVEFEVNLLSHRPSFRCRGTATP